MKKLFVSLLFYMIVNYTNSQTTAMIREYFAPNTNAPVMVIFGGNPDRMNEVVSMIRDSIGTITVIGTFSEQEGIDMLSNINKVDLVLIGGRYSLEERIRIRSYVKEHLSNVLLTEPGYDYPYDNREILKDIQQKLKITH